LPSANNGWSANLNGSPVCALASAVGRNGCNPSARASAAISTASTPGIVRAFSVSMRSIRA
jgi:hypothetical protein